MTKKSWNVSLFLNVLFYPTKWYTWPELNTMALLFRVTDYGHDIHNRETSVTL